VGEECDETTEEDLTYLKDPCLNINLVVINYLIIGHIEGFLHKLD
jgi:hypothetical protein